jgi:tetratricopeptide (TPR) repeat protein
VEVVLESIAPAPAGTAGPSVSSEASGPAVEALSGAGEKQLKKGIEALDAGDAAAALALFTELAAVEPDRAQPHFYSGVAQAELGANEEAAAAFQRSIEIAPEMGQAQFNLAKVLVALGRHDEAVEAFTAAAESEAVEADRCWQIAANLFIEERNFPKVIHCLERYDAVHPGDAGILFRLGSVHFNEGNMDQALDAFQRAIEADPGMLDVYYQLGLVYLNRGENDKARETFETLIATAPDHPLAATARDLMGAIQ